MFNSVDLAGMMAFISAYAIFFIVIDILCIVANWKIFTKAGRPGWHSIIPIYSTYALFEIVGLKGWYIFLIFIPFVGSLIITVFSVVASLNLAKCFGKSTGFGVGLFFLPFIFQLILAFDSSTYTKPEVPNK